MADATLIMEIKGLDKLLKKYDKAPQIVEPIMQEAIVRSGVVLATHTDRSTVPFKIGDLIRSFKPIDIGRLFARWYPRVNYARAIQFGMPPSPGRYVPAIGKRLVNGSNIGMWPGIKGRHYMEKIMGASRVEINNEFKIALKEVTDAMAR